MWKTRRAPVPRAAGDKRGPGSRAADDGWTCGITNDWQDANAYPVYDEEEEHNRLRREVFARVCRDIGRASSR